MQLQRQGLMLCVMCTKAGSTNIASQYSSAADQTKYVSRRNERRHLHNPVVTVMSQTLPHQGNL